MRRSRRRLALLVPLVLLAALSSLSACGSDDEAQAVAALKSQIVGNDAMQGQGDISDEQSSCIAEGAVDAIGVDQLQDYRIIDDEFDLEKRLDQVPMEEKDAAALADVFVDCTEAERIFEDGLVARLATGKAAARKQVTACVREKVTTDVVRDILSQSFQQTDATAYESLGQSLGACGAP